MAVLLWLFVRELDWHQLGVALRDARWWPLLPAVAIAFGMLWCAAFGLRIMLAPRHVVSTPRLFRYTIVAYAASVIAPARAGELVGPDFNTYGGPFVLELDVSIDGHRQTIRSPEFTREPPHIMVT